MGLKNSPVNSVQGVTVAKCHILGDPKEESNPFAWHAVISNLPGLEEYDSSLPWVMKVRKDGTPASSLAGYVNDFRVVARDESAAWKCSSSLAKGLCWLGIQDAARKHRRLSMSPGAWAGATVTLHDLGVSKGVTQERWDKLWLRIQWRAYHLGMEVDQLLDEVKNLYPEVGEPPVDHIHMKTSESISGFIVYVSLKRTQLSCHT